MNRKLAYQTYQQGVVLFIALVALVVMSLAAVALIRSVDTNTVISGNLAFKQSTVAASDSGAEAAFTWLQTMAAAGNLAALNANIVAQGYHATIPDLHQPPPYVEVNLEDPVILKDVANTWDNNNSAAVAAGSDGNSMRYIVQRMCLQAIDPDPSHCLFGDIPSGGEAIDNVDQYKAGAAFNVLPSPMYRVTVRVTGPKNTVSYVQAYAY